MLKKLTPDWQNWIIENLQRGCTPESLLEPMQKNHFSLSDAQQHIEHIRAELANAPAATVDDSVAYIYEPSRILSGNNIILKDKVVTVSARIAQPDIVVFENFLSPEECETLIERSREKLRRSTVIDPESGEKHIIDNRSSDGCFFKLNEDPFIQTLDERIAELMNWPLEHGEGIQILRYPVGAEYRPHFDYFPPEHPGSAKHMAKGGQRVATLVMYLNNVPSGGETQFPSIHLSVTPRQGSATYFAYLNSHGQVDPATLHAGTPVLAGEKWIATKWMRQFPY